MEGKEERGGSSMDADLHSPCGLQLSHRPLLSRRTAEVNREREREDKNKRGEYAMYKGE